METNDNPKPNGSMSFEERINKLTERHEALTQTVELIAHQIVDFGKTVDDLGKKVDGMEKHVAALTDNMTRLMRVTRRNTHNISSLIYMLELHEDRISGLEKGGKQ